MTARYLIACLLLSLSTAVWCQVAPLPTTDDFREGDTWTWRRIDDPPTTEPSISWRRSIVEDDEQAFMSSSKRSFTIDQVYQGIGWREWPLQVGKGWDYATNWSSPAGDPGTTVEHAVVVAYEAVTVPAGRFMAFRIEYKGHWDLTNAEGRHRTGDVVETYWYAPDVKADVKQQFVSSGKYASQQWTSELVNYVPARSEAWPLVHRPRSTPLVSRVRGNDEIEDVTATSQYWHSALPRPLRCHSPDCHPHCCHPGGGRDPSSRARPSRTWAATFAGVTPRKARHTHSPSPRTRDPAASVPWAPRQACR